MSAVTDFYNNLDLKDGFGATAGRQRPHGGLDNAKPSGTPIPALFSGTVVGEGISAELGCYIQIQSSNGKVFSYCHPENPSPLNIGDHVSQGQTVNLVGARGYATGPHLHLSVGNTLSIGFAYCEDPLPWVRMALAGHDITDGAGPTGGGYTAGDLGIPRTTTEEDGVTGRIFNQRLQLWGRQYGGYAGPLDGSLGTESWKAIQRNLTREYGYTGPIDGAPGVNTWKAFQRWASRYGYLGPIDGVPGPKTWRAVAKALNTL